MKDEDCINYIKREYLILYLYIYTLVFEPVNILVLLYDEMLPIPSGSTGFHGAGVLKSFPGSLIINLYYTIYIYIYYITLDILY